MTMPETIWAMPARQLMWVEDNTQGFLVKGYAEYVLRSSVQAMIDTAVIAALRKIGDAEPANRCCLGLSEAECALTPSRHCEGMKK